MPDAARPACPLCRSADATFRRGHRYPGIDFEYRYHRCGACTAEYVWPQPDERALAAIYDDAAYYGHASTAAASEDLSSYRERLARFESMLGRKGTLLDVGAGTGTFLECARDQGWTPMGVEISRFGRERALSLGLDVREGAIETVDLPAAHFDAIHAWAVFEHLLDPARFVERARELVRPGGLLAIRTINAGSLNARWYGRDWEYCQDPGHIIFPTERSLRRLFERAGFQVTLVEYVGNPVGINRLSATNNEAGIKSPRLKELLLGAKARVLGNPQLRATVKRAFHALRLGDMFNVYARPR